MTETTSDFDAWLDANEPEIPEELYSLYMAVKQREDMGFCTVTTKGDKTFVKGPASQLLLLSEKARQSFLAKVDELKGDAELDMESWYGFRRNIANPHA